MEAFEEVLQPLVEVAYHVEKIALYDWMMKTLHYYNDLDGTWIVSKSTFSSCF
jgi:hypothetical protein